MSDAASRIRAVVRELEDLLDQLEEVEPIVAAPSGSGPKLAIVVGHTRERPGALGGPPIGTFEYPWNTELAAQMSAAAATLPIQVRTFFRDGVGVAGAYGEAQTWGADASLELHFNSFSSPSATGTETIVGNQRGAKEFGEQVQRAMLDVLGLRSRGVKKPVDGRGAQNVGVLSKPSILLEPFFGSNPGDAAAGAARKGEYARAVMSAASDWLNRA